MSHVDDARLLFFIEHAQQIREWARLEPEVTALADRFLTETARRWSSSEEHPSDAIPEVASEGRWKKFGLRESDWETEDGDPLVGVFVGWDSRDVGLDAGAAAYVGVRAWSNEGRGGLVDELRGALADHRHGTQSDSSRHWPTFRRVPPESTSDDLAAYADQLRSALLSEWEATSGTIRRVLEARR